MSMELDSVVRRLTRGAEDTNTSLQVVKHQVKDGVVQYTIYAPYLNCPYLRLPKRLWSFLKARWVLRSDQRVKVQLSFSPETIFSTCEHGTEHTTRVFRATLKVETSDGIATQELLKFEDGIRYYYYACSDRSPKTA